MDIIFHCDEINERGTSIACFDYALNNEIFLGNNSVIIYNKNLNNNQLILKKFQSRFKVISYEDFHYIDKEISNNYDLMYVIKGGNVDSLCSKFIPTMVHAVFPQNIFQIHGSSYAFVSEWLSKKSSYIIPYVPHVVNYPKLSCQDNLRELLYIPKDATVFASYGGKNSFDIEFVKNKVIPEVLQRKNNIYFLFMNYEKFINHPRAKFLPLNVDRNYKERFVASADAMLHARSLGESFGLACAEFSSKNKPVISYKFSKDKNHEFVLSSSIILYRNASALIRILIEFDKKKYETLNNKAYLERYNPELVMEKFDKYLIRPAIKSKITRIRINNISLPSRIIFNKIFKFLSKLFLPYLKIRNIFLKVYSSL